MKVKNPSQTNVTGKINVSKGKRVEESSKNDSSDDESSNEVFCVV